MIVVRLWGGLGNQMFQYAFGYAMAKSRGMKLKLDTYFFSKKYQLQNGYTNQKLQITSLPIEFSEEVNTCGENKMVSFLQRQNINRLCKILPKFNLPLGNGLIYIKETRLSYLDSVVNANKPNIYLDGYWQTERYFSDYRNELLSQFNFESQVTNDYAKQIGITDRDVVAVHMRLGDYGKKQRFVNYNYVINPKYYLNAMEKIKQDIPGARFYIFSNDLNKVRQLLKNSVEYVFVNEDRLLNDMEEFRVMSICPNQIISNSTFSWWAAWLNTNPDKIIYAPDVFFGNKDIIPKTWKK